MPDLVVIVPSRGRPDAARALVQAFHDTCTADTRLVFAVDDDDPTHRDYPGTVVAGPNKSMVEALNNTASLHTGPLFGAPPPFAIGFMGDDHRPRTFGWDHAYLEALRDLGTGIVYGDDLLQGERLPTQCALTTDIVATLGYMAPPTLTHMYVDNFWLSLGRTADCIRYLPDVMMEHLHPIAGKAGWDPGYVRVNNAAMYRRDEAAFTDYVREQLAADVSKVRALRAVDA